MYTNLEAAYNDNNQELDKMAKKLNKKKDNLFNSEQNEFDRVEKKWKHDITSYNNYMNYKDPHATLMTSESGGLLLTNPQATIVPSVPETNEQYATFNNNNLEDISIDSISIDSPTIDSYIDSIKSDNTKPIHKIITEINSEDCSKDSDDIYDHIKKCKECKLKLLKYITTSHNTKKSLSSELKTDYYEDIYKKRKSLFNYFGEIEHKEIIVIIMLGIFIIILLDFMMKGVGHSYTTCSKIKNKL